MSHCIHEDVNGKLPLHHIQESNKDNEMKLPCKKVPKVLESLPSQAQSAKWNQLKMNL